jgi:hypothetical protein
MLPKTGAGQVVRVEHDTSWSHAHVVVHGDLVVAPGAHLTLNDVVLELAGDAKQAFGLVVSKGAELRATDTFFGGNERRAAATQIYGAVRLRRACVQYSEGVHVYEGSLTADAFGRGPASGNVLLKGVASVGNKAPSLARVKLVDSDVSLGLFFDASRASGNVDLALPSGEASGMFGSDWPGAMFSVELERARVPLWLLFFSGVREQGASPAVTYRLKESSTVLPNVVVDAPTERPFHGDLELRAQGSMLGAFGQVRLERSVPLDGESALSWGLSLSGPGVRTKVAGGVRIGSVLLRDRAELSLEGTAGTKDLKLLASNVRIADSSRLYVKNATVAQDSGTTSLGALIELKGAARAVFDRVDLGLLGVRQERAYQAGFIDARPVGASALELSGQPVPVPLRRGLTLEQGTRVRSDRLWVGASFRVGSKALVLSRLGRRNAERSEHTHRVVLLDQAYAVVADSRVEAGRDHADDDGVSYGPPAQHITLAAGGTYYLLSDETEGAETWPSDVPAKGIAPLFQDVRAVTMQSLHTLPVQGAAGAAHAGVQLQVWDDALPVRR